jgi:hypothetical protein
VCVCVETSCKGYIQFLSIRLGRGVSFTVPTVYCEIVPMINGGKYVRRSGGGDAFVARALSPNPSTLHI